MKSYLIKNLFFITIFALFSGCSDSGQVQAEQKLKTALMELDKLVGESTMEELMVGTKPEKAQKYYQVIEEIEKFTIDYPDSRYADDASFILTDFLYSGP